VIGGVHDRIGGYKGDCGGMRCGIAVAICYLITGEFNGGYADLPTHEGAYEEKYIS
jgi:hypothetical protein